MSKKTLLVPAFLVSAALGGCNSADTRTTQSQSSSPQSISQPNSEARQSDAPTTQQQSGADGVGVFDLTDGTVY